MSTSKTKTSELTGTALDWAVAQCENALWIQYDRSLRMGRGTPSRPSEYLRDHDYTPQFSPSTNWAQGGPIVEREGMTLRCGLDGWDAELPEFYGCLEFGASALKAAMRCYVSAKLGDEVEIPDELIAGVQL